MKILSCFVFISAAFIGFTAAFDREQYQSFLRRSDNNVNENQQHSIETRELEQGLFSISVTRPTDYDNDESRRLRPATPEYRSCVLYLEDLYYLSKDEKDVEEKWVCIVQNYVSRYGNIATPRAFYVSGGGEKFEKFLKSEAVSASHVLRWNDPEMVTLNDVDENDNLLILNSDITEDRDSLWIETKDEYEKEEQGEDEETSKRKLQSEVVTTGIKKTLVIRVVGDGVGPTPSLAKIREEVFGSGTSLKSQIESCSHGQLVIEPFSGPTGGKFNQEIIGGVVEIGIQTNPYGKNDKRMENDAIYAASYVFGNMEAQFDLVLFVMPPGISPAFAAYAYVRTPFSFYSNSAIESAMVLMHEVGHNLGLEHSGEGDYQYGDASGYMGYSEVDDPKMCFNAVNNFQLGWYSKLSIKPTGEDVGGTFYITGVDGYDPSDTTTFVTIRLEQETMASDYYVGYNKAEGINSGTQNDGDKVIVFTKDGSVDESVNSWKKAALQVGESYVIDDFDNSGRSVIVAFTSIESNAAVIEITPETSESPTASPRPSNSPTTSPSFSPTSSPSSSPTSSPTFSPSFSPTSTPSESPSAEPTTQATVTTTFVTTTSITSTTTFPTTKTNETETISTTPTLTANVTETIPLPSTTNGTAAAFLTNETANATTCDDELFLNIDIRTDYFPEETWWILRKIGGEDIDRIDPATYQTPFANYTNSYCLEYDSCYLFKIFDTSEDGMGFVGESTAATGYYQAYLGSERQFRKDGAWGEKKIHKFCTPPSPLALGNETDFEYNFEGDSLGDNDLLN